MAQGGVRFCPVQNPGYGTAGATPGWMMGGEQSHEQTAEQRGDEAERGPPRSSSAGSEPAAPEDSPGELPQCRMGDRKVDNMCFMISCTNWY